MRLTLFSRLILGYLAVFALVIAVSLYAQVRYERKFVIAKDQTLYREFLKFKGDFERYLNEASGIADPKLGALLSQVKQDYERYHELFDKETVQIRAHREYPQGWYNREKNQITDRILGLLEQLQAERQQGTYSKVRELADAGARARDAALTITIASLLFILILSLLIARSITRPISILKNKTREIASGRFEADLRLSSPPEIAELAASFNLMCQLSVGSVENGGRDDELQL